MVRGIEKRVIYIKLPKEGSFEEAYFILRGNDSKEAPKEGEMVREANRIIFELYGVKQRRKKAKFGVFMKEKGQYLLYGGLFGSVLVSLCWLLTLIIG